MIELDAGQGKILRAEAVAEVAKFNSGNSNRDSHALEVFEALKYPSVCFKITYVQVERDDITVVGLLSFHGQTREIAK